MSTINYYYINFPKEADRMQVGVTRDMVEEVLSQALIEIKTSRKTVNSFKKQLSAHGVGLADSQRIINGKTPLNKVENSVLCLLLIHIRDFIEDQDLKNKITAENYFTQHEINEINLMEFSTENEELLPYTFSDAKQFELDDYDTSIDAEQLLKLSEGNVIQYNFETQREAKLLKVATGIIKAPKLNGKAVKEITQLILEDKLFRTTITFNARLNSSDSGQELIFDTKNKTLTVTEGTKLDCLDGFHRLTATINAIKINPDIKMTFGLRIVNYSQKKAQSLFSQINTFTSQSVSRLAEMRQSHSSYVVKQLREESMLGDKISSGDQLSTDQLVTFTVLDSIIDEVFHPSNIIEAKEVVGLLKETFDSIAMRYPEEFVTNIGKTRKETIINHNQMFNAYVILAKELKDVGLPPSHITTLIDKIDFSRSNPLWKEIGVLDNNSSMMTKPKSKIINFFKKLDVKEEINNV
ncbi:hypothetical protein EEL31_08985 [Brevibacillus laterosporus]|nr:hypothetical protein EEL31_08985 [Brevibacillus laterosporus]